MEVKFTERGFGSCQGNPAHRTKLDGIYRAKLADKVKQSAFEEDTSFGHYQFWRNIAYADAKQEATVLFLMPRGNPELNREWETVFAELTDEVRPAVRRVFLEEVLEDLMTTVPHSDARLGAYVELLVEKYLVR